MEKRVSHVLAEAEKAQSTYDRNSIKEILIKFYASASVSCNEKTLGYIEAEQINSITINKVNEPLEQHPLI